MKTRVLITGATGNVGLATIKALCNLQHNFDIIAGVRNLNKDHNALTVYPIKYVIFDFENMESQVNALDGCDVLLLVRPPQISDTRKYFLPLIELAKSKGVQHIIFLSVQGAEHSRIIPHNKIERMIIDSQINYTFLRPAYFMQNFLTTLDSDLRKGRIFLPAGDAKFTLVDVEDIGDVAASVITNYQNPSFINTSFELTNSERLDFKEMAETMSRVLHKDIKYYSPSLLKFFLAKRSEQYPIKYIFVLIMLHYFPRFQSVPDITDCIEKIARKSPVTFEQFLIKNQERFNAIFLL